MDSLYGIAEGRGLTRGKVRGIARAVSIATRTPISPIWNLIDDIAGEKISDELR